MTTGLKFVGLSIFLFLLDYLMRVLVGHGFPIVITVAQIIFIMGIIFIIFGWGRK